MTGLLDQLDAGGFNDLEKSQETTVTVKSSFHGIRLCIFGSRTLQGKSVRDILTEYVNEIQPCMIVTASEPAGVCAEAQAVAKLLCIPLKTHFINFRYRGGAFHHRSKSILEESDHVLLIHDGESRGTLNEKAIL